MAVIPSEIRVIFQPVASSRITDMAYDYAKRIVYVIFPDGTLWQYENVPRSEWNKFRVAPSKGNFINTVLQKKYPNKRTPK